MPRLPVTDPGLLKELARQRIDPADVSFDQDYAVHGRGKRHGPYAKFYSCTAGVARERQFMVVSGLPMVDADDARLTPGWQAQGASGRFVERKNLYNALIQGRDVELTVKNDDAVGRKKGWTLAYSPRLFVGGVEVPPAAPVLVDVDPWNANYAQNVLEWDYGVCKRKIRTVEGRVHGYWVFPANPGGDVLIRYGQTGDYRLKLGPFKQGEDEEFIPASVFAAAIYPFEVSDSATYYPDANPETTSVDGIVTHTDPGATWATFVSGAGTGFNDFVTGTYIASWLVYQFEANKWTTLTRGIALFDSSSLPDGANISAATLSFRGNGKDDPQSNVPTINAFASAPASNTVLAAGDFDSLGSTAFATAMPYADWSTIGYNDYALNASGMAAISRTGVTKLGLRLSHDVTGSQPTWAAAANTTGMFSFFSEQGDGYKPKLVVTYTVPFLTALMAHKMIAAGAL